MKRTGPLTLPIVLYYTLIRRDKLIYCRDELVYRRDELIYHRDELAYRPDELILSSARI